MNEGLIDYDTNQLVELCQFLIEHIRHQQANYLIQKEFNLGQKPPRMAVFHVGPLHHSRSASKWSEIPSTQRKYRIIEIVLGR